MSSFKVYHGTTGSALEKEYRGTAIVADAFNAKLPSGGFDDDEERRVFFEEMIFDLISNRGCTVTYWDGGEYTVSALRKESGKVVVSYVDGQGVRKRLKVIAMQDDIGSRTVHMVIPADRIDPDSSPYVDEAISQFRNHDMDAQMRRFLLGMLLLKKCR